MICSHCGKTKRIRTGEVYRADRAGTGGFTATGPFIIMVIKNNNGDLEPLSLDGQAGEERCEDKNCDVKAGHWLKAFEGPLARKLRDEQLIELETRQRQCT